MNKRNAYTIEYPMRCSPQILFEFLSTSDGLQEWFADSVEQKDDLFHFSWEHSEDHAQQMESIENELVRYRWQDAEDDEYFEFKIIQSLVTNETILQITDFAADYELKDQQLLWDSQISDLKQRVGS